MRRWDAAGHVVAVMLAVGALGDAASWAFAQPMAFSASVRVPVAVAAGVLLMVAAQALRKRLAPWLSSAVVVIGSVALGAWATRSVGALAAAASNGIDGADERALLAAAALAAALAFVGATYCARWRMARQSVVLLSLTALVLAFVAALLSATDSDSPGLAFPLAAAALVAFSLAHIADAGTNRWPQSVMVAPARRDAVASVWPMRRGLLWFGLLTFATVAGAGYLYIRREQAQALHSTQALLSAVADLKVQGIAAWYHERKADAELLAGTTVSSDELQRVLEGSATPDDVSRLSAWMGELTDRYDYVAVALLDQAGNVRLVRPQAAELQPTLSERARAMAQMRGVQSEDLHREGEDGAIRLNFWVPVGGPDGTPAGVLVLQTDPRAFLYPMLQSWPMPSKSAETLLVRRDGDAVLFLNQLRHRADTALRLRVPLHGSRALPALLAVSGRPTVVEGLDYRGVPVVAAVREVPGTPWFMVSKVDQDESYAALRERAWLLSWLVAALGLVALLGTLVLWRQRNLGALRRELVLQQANVLGELRYRRLVENISDALMIDDLEGRVTYVNDRFLEMYGFAREDIPGLIFDAFCAPAFRQRVRARHERRVAGEDVESEFEYLALRKDGSEFWVEVRVSKVIEDGRLLGTQSTIQDITERKRAEQVQIALLQISEAAHAATDMADLYRRIHEIIGSLLPAQNIYLALYDEATDEVSFPYFVDACDPQPPPQKLGEISLTAIVLRSGQALLINASDTEQRRQRGDPIVGTLPVEWLGVPLISKGRTIGALAVQSYDVSVCFAERDKTLLQFVGAQVATAIERKRAEAAMRESEEKFRALFDQSPNLIGLLTIPEGRIVEVNQAAITEFGGTYETIIGRTSAEIGMWAEPRERERYLELLARHGRVSDFEAVLRRRSGATFPVLFNGALVTIGGQQYSLNVMQDISARKQAEQHLGESRAAIRNLQLALDEHAIVAITNPDGRLTYVNDKFCTVTGYTREQALGRSHEILNSGYHPQAFFNELWATIRSGRVWKGEIRNRARDGTTFWVDTTIVPFLDAAGQPYQYVTIRTDITERKRAEDWQRHYARTLGLITAEASLSVVLEGVAGFAEQAGEKACCVITLRDGHGRRPLRGPAANRAVSEALAALASEGPSADAAARRLVQLGHGDGLSAGLRQRAANVPGEQVEDTDYRSCAAEPIIAADHQVLGTLALYQPTLSRPRSEDMELLRQSAALAALAIERARHQSDQRLAKVVFEQSVEAIVVTDDADRIVMVNPAFETLTGYTADSVVGKTPQLLNSDRHDAVFHARVGETIAREDWWQGEFWCRHQSGESLPTLLSIVAVRDAGGAITHRIRVMADISEQKFQAARIEQLAFYDSLTALPNRALFLDRLEQTLDAARRQAEHGALLFLDLDRFKEINDSQGHAAGDQALVEVARRFLAVSRKEETLARLGGDEFVLIAEGARQGSAALIAERLLSVLAEPLRVGQSTLALAASIGIALYPDDGDSVEDLIKHADIAMYRAKAAGGGYRFYQPAMGESLRKRLDLARRLERALGDGGLHLFYQPKVSLTAQRLSGAEALLRWQDAELGWISPSEFIPLAEERGMIGALGAWVFREACMQLAAWQNDGHAMVGRLAINLSALQLQLPHLVNSLVTQVESLGLSAHQFELELTESSMMADPERAITTMDALHRAGFSLAVDDFGTGYSSLVYLKRFAARNIKIDMSFVRDMLTDRNDAAIVSTIVAMARNLGMQTTAEGVETAQQAQALLELGCDFAQGFHFGRPEPAADFARQWLGAGAVASTGTDP